MRSVLLLVLAVAGCLPALRAQDSPYADSLQAYRAQYTADLYPIIKDDTAYLSFYTADPGLIVEAGVQLLENEKPFRLITSSGKTKEARKYALLRFTLQGKPCQLYVYQLLKLLEKAETADELFLPFTDHSNGKTTYGGGRYIDLRTSDIREGKVTIDFNKAYNPYCAFTTGYNCPIPPRENTLPLKVAAGERYRAKKFKH